jgi:hypothetical protein
VVIRDTDNDTTYVLIERPRHGTWQIRPTDASAPITEVAVADGLPPVSISARVMGHGGRRALSYRVRPLAGQTVRFVERARSLEHLIGTAHGRTGVLRFAPGSGPAGSRQIVAMVDYDRLPRTRVVVARYVAPPPARPGRPGRISVVRHGASLAVRWRPAAGPLRAYNVLLRTPGGRRTLRQTRARHRAVRFTDALPDERAKVTITPIGTNMLFGPSRTASSSAVKH